MDEVINPSTATYPTDGIKVWQHGHKILPFDESDIKVSRYIIVLYSVYK